MSNIRKFEIPFVNVLTEKSMTFIKTTIVACEREFCF